MQRKFLVIGLIKIASGHLSENGGIVRTMGGKKMIKAGKIEMPDQGYSEI